MFRKKWVHVLLWTSGVLLVAAMLGLWGMQIVADKILHSIAAAGHQEQAAPAPSVRPSQAAPVPSVQPSSERELTSPPAAESSVPVNQPAAPNPGQLAQPTQLPQSPPSPAQTPAGLPYEANISTEKAEQAQEQVTLQEKALITSIFVKRFSMEELMAFTKLAGGGLSVEEKREAKKIVMEKLTEEEYDQLIKIAAKLGLSQGKSYKDSRKEFVSPAP